MAREPAQRKTFKDDPNAFTVVIGSRVAAVLDCQDDADANVKDITFVENFSVSAPNKELLKNASLKISRGKRYGLVGTKGKGKSTLLKLLAWRKIPVPENIDVLLVEHEIVGDDRTALEAVVSANEELVKPRQEAATFLEGENGNESLQIMGSDAAEAHASKILAGLGFTKAMQNLATRSFSGGWRKRISLARALFVQPTLLLLDEPTNRLDLSAVLWLEEYLGRWKETLVVVSHDQVFLNAICNGIIHLHDHKLYMYHGNFDDFQSELDHTRRRQTYEKSETYEKLAKAVIRAAILRQEQ